MNSTVDINFPSALFKSQSIPNQEMSMKADKEEELKESGESEKEVVVSILCKFASYACNFLPFVNSLSIFRCSHL